MQNNDGRSECYCRACLERKPSRRDSLEREWPICDDCRPQLDRMAVEQVIRETAKQYRAVHREAR